MKKLFVKFKDKVNKAVAIGKKALTGIFMTVARSRRALANNRAEGYIDTAIKILIAVVLGALLLAGLYALLGNTVLPTLTDRIKEMFNYAG